MSSILGFFGDFQSFAAPGNLSFCPVFCPASDFGRKAELRFRLAEDAHRPTRELGRGLQGLRSGPPNLGDKSDWISRLLWGASPVAGSSSNIRSHLIKCLLKTVSTWILRVGGAGRSRSFKSHPLLGSMLARKCVLKPRSDERYTRRAQWQRSWRPGRANPSCQVLVLAPI